MMLMTKARMSSATTMDSHVWLWENIATAIDIANSANNPRRIRETRRVKRSE
jgi:hypothetical protein